MQLLTPIILMLTLKNQRMDGPCYVINALNYNAKFTKNEYCKLHA